MRVDAAFFPDFGISSDTVVNVDHGESALASSTMAARVVLRLAVAPASILALPLLEEAALSGDTTVGPSLRVRAKALGMAGSRHGLGR